MNLGDLKIFFVPGTFSGVLRNAHRWSVDCNNSFPIPIQWKQHERQLMEEENERILEFARQQQKREEDRMEKKKQQEESMAAVQTKVG